MLLARAVVQLSFLMVSISGFGQKIYIDKFLDVMDSLEYPILRKNFNEEFVLVVYDPKCPYTKYITKELDYSSWKSYKTIGIKISNEISPVDSIFDTFYDVGSTLTNRLLRVRKSPLFLLLSKNGDYVEVIDKKGLEHFLLKESGARIVRGFKGYPFSCRHQ